MLQYRCDDQGGPQPPKPWKEGDKKHPHDPNKPNPSDDQGGPQPPKP